ncbi:MAG: adaptor protein MecA, partial [Oscillospiraceae bacterium]|nr:adaptor protein MecA [Oscillospiraceae bacterium]
MKFEKLTENKIRIILNLDDLHEKNIDFHSFMSNSLESQDLFFDMLEKAEKEIGFNTRDYK